MWDITSCKLFPQGDIYSWNTDDWEPSDMELYENETSVVQYRMVNISQSSLCKTVEKYTFFPDKYTFYESINLCRRFGGKLVDVSTSEKANSAVNFLAKDIMENPKYSKVSWMNPYSMYTDEKELNVWRHYETGELPTDPLIMNSREPNGGMVENCAQLVVPPTEAARFNDNTCEAPTVVACEDIGGIVIKFRGICKYSLIDTTYSMVEGDLNEKRFFAGNTGWRIFWDADRELWRLSSPKKENMFGLHTEFATYPLGKNYWRIVNDTRCTYPNPERVLINMSPCNSSSFTCDDGTCIPMTMR
jgi:hypothetical protein